MHRAGQRSFLFIYFGCKTPKLSKQSNTKFHFSGSRYDFPSSRPRWTSNLSASEIVAAQLLQCKCPALVLLWSASESWMILGPFLWFSRDFGEKTLQFSMKTFFFWSLLKFREKNSSIFAEDLFFWSSLYLLTWDRGRGSFPPMLKIGKNWGKIANYPPNAQQRSAPLCTAHGTTNLSWAIWRNVANTIV